MILSVLLLGWVVPLELTNVLGLKVVFVALSLLIISTTVSLTLYSVAIARAIINRAHGSSMWQAGGSLVPNMEHAR
jgi:hypothetical protein